MVEPRVFVSFTSIITKQKKILFIGQSRNSKTPFSVQDWSAKSSMPQSQWETLVKEKINICNILIVLVGKTMASASGVQRKLCSPPAR